MKSPGRLTAMPSQIVFAERAPIGRSRGERVDVGRARLRLHAHHARAVSAPRQREADAAREPAAARAGPPPASGQVPGAASSSPTVPWPGHHLRLVEGVHRREALGLGRGASPPRAPRRSRRPRSAPRRRTGAPPRPWRAAPAPASRAPRVRRPRAPRTPPPVRGFRRWPPRRPRPAPPVEAGGSCCVAPRALNEPVSWRFSAFSSTRAPMRRDSSPDGEQRRLAHTAREWPRGVLDVGVAHGFFRGDGHSRWDYAPHGHRARRRLGCSPTPRSSRDLEQRELERGGPGGRAAALGTRAR